MISVLNQEVSSGRLVAQYQYVCPVFCCTSSCLCVIIADTRSVSTGLIKALPLHDTIRYDTIIADTTRMLFNTRLINLLSRETQYLDALSSTGLSVITRKSCDWQKLNHTSRLITADITRKSVVALLTAAVTYTHKTAQRANGHNQ